MKKTFLYAFRQSLPIMIAFFPLGIAYGVLMQSAGYNFLWSGACSLFVFAGALQFLMVDFFTGAAPLATVAVMALLLNSRHIFFGLSFLERFRKYDPLSRLFLIFSLSDESYSLHCAYHEEAGVIEKWAFVFTGGFVMFYWIVFSMLGGLIGSLITFDTTGIDFALTALFVVILLDQLKGASVKLPAIIAVLSSVLCILVFGPGSFILPSLILTVAALVLLRGRMEQEAAA